MLCCVLSSQESYDGFVVVHGTDTMAFTASALSFLLENLGKPVVITGSQIPLGQYPSRYLEIFLSRDRALDLLRSHKQSYALFLSNGIAALLS